MTIALKKWNTKSLAALTKVTSSLDDFTLPESLANATNATNSSTFHHEER
jgi:hypothetical protein